MDVVRKVTRKRNILNPKFVKIETTRESGTVSLQMIAGMIKPASERTGGGNEEARTGCFIVGSALCAAAAKAVI